MIFDHLARSALMYDANSSGVLGMDSLAPAATRSRYSGCNIADTISFWLRTRNSDCPGETVCPRVVVHNHTLTHGFAQPIAKRPGVYIQDAPRGSGHDYPNRMFRVCLRKYLRY